MGDDGRAAHGADADRAEGLASVGIPEDGGPPSHAPAARSVVEIIDGAGKWVGRGFYNGHSRIALRVLTDREDEPLDAAFFQKKITQAVPCSCVANCSASTKPPTPIASSTPRATA
jgi:23S rRNA G2069 N7-methylase RlmK/C1962 C5-methylase RlmI